MTITKSLSPMFAAATLAGTALLAGCGDTGGGTRDNIRAVGSSTVYPFATMIAESLAQSNPNLNSPIIEATGSGAGIALFCQGLGADTPDIANASRRMKPSEFETCQANGVTDIIEIQVGLDGIAFASAKDGITMNLTPKIFYEAIAANPYGEAQTASNWSDVDPSLPNLPILIYGPPSTSGTRDAMNELVLEKACEADPRVAEIEATDETRAKQICTELRNDGAFVSQGEQDNLVVKKIEANPRAVGVFGYSYLEENAQILQGLKMNGVEPTYDNIASFEYPGARPLYMYVKKAHLDAIEGLKEYLAEWTKNWGRDGALAKKGLVASPTDAMAENERRATQFDTITADDLG